ncbi:MAG: iron-sulfur cluster assembly scaffold protein [Candidatus Curtissbacteria bacterium]|nr:iron-sulfur cluster assembly scaffold protein [Candidatus Curtissbacteria bacterium]
MDIYREEILDHWRNPQNFGEMKKPDVVIDQVNPLCGDEITFFFKFEKKRTLNFELRNSKLKEVTFTGSGCAISIASASILSENIRGKSVSALSKITGRDVLKLIGGSVAPARLKCAFLALEALRKLRVNS